MKLFELFGHPKMSYDNLSWYALKKLKKEMGDNFPSEAEEKRKILSSENYNRNTKPKAKEKKSNPNEFGKVALQECKTRINSMKKKGRNLEIDITEDYLQQMLVKQNYRCAITNTPFSWEPGCKGNVNYYRASVDRIDSKLGYVKGNIQIILSKINLMKGDWEEEDFQNFVIKLSGCFLKRKKSK